jgi:hypothetical protein
MRPCAAAFNPAGDRPSARIGSDFAARWRLRFSGKVQFDADAIRIVEEELRIAGARHDALAEFDAFRLQRLRMPSTSVAAKAMWSSRPVSSYFFSVPRTTMPSRGLRVPIRCTVAVPPE